ncbi:metallophosphoesterase [Pseudomonas sp. LG1E9]|uniref:metallophosphoesterase n=1 Tax=Pseudomonas sp. LG1E9 TaxID=2219057 RepID=UPI000DD40DBB|nr:metallophosphoesterase [Pseudomonas sp. LG1E9]
MSSIKVFESNPKGRDFVVGDIHGHFKLLASLLEKVDFNTQQDRLFCVGDLIDRGPDSIDVLKWLSEPWFYGVRGNHEQMLIDCLSGRGDINRHTRNGGAWLYALSPSVQNEIYNLLQTLPVMIEVNLSDGRKIGIVHAEAFLSCATQSWQDAKDAISGMRGESAQQQALKTALYARERIEQQNQAPIIGLDKLYVGHSTVPHVHTLGNVVYTDTGCSFSDGTLSVIDIVTGEVSHVSMRLLHDSLGAGL